MKKITNIYKRIDKRGIFLECINGPLAWKSINGGFMNKDALMGNHYHKKNRTLFFLLSGKAIVYCKNLKNASRVRNFNIKSNQGVIFDPYETHAWRFTENSYFLLLKSEKYSSTEPDTYEGKVV